MEMLPASRLSDRGWKPHRWQDEGWEHHWRHKELLLGLAQSGCAHPHSLHLWVQHPGYGVDLRQNEAKIGLDAQKI